MTISKPHSVTPSPFAIAAVGAALAVALTGCEGELSMPMTSGIGQCPSLEDSGPSPDDGFQASEQGVDDQPKNDAPPETSPRNLGYQFPKVATRASTAPIKVVPTFHNLGLYWKARHGDKGQEALVRFRKKGLSHWRQGLSLWFDFRNLNGASERSNEYRGSLLQLASGTIYEIELLDPKTGELAKTSARTWAEDFPVEKTIIVGNSNKTLVIDQSGSSTGYVLYTAAPGKTATIDVINRHEFGVDIRASYVIVRGLVVKGARRHGINLRGPVRNVVIEDNDISGWGRWAKDGWGCDRDSGIAVINGWSQAINRQVRQIVVQNNNIHHPRTDANNWTEQRRAQDDCSRDTKHPKGPHGLVFARTGGNHVIRYNRIYSDPQHQFNDGIGGSANFSYAGAPGRDSDIYGNRISHVWDDAVESEGDNTNVRIYQNHTDQTYVSFGLSTVSIGPLYLFRNVAYRHAKSPGDRCRGVLTKGQSKSKDGIFWGGGRTYILHNSVYQRQGVPCVTAGISSAGHVLLNYVVRNNILHTKSVAITSMNTKAPWALPNSFDFDLFSAKLAGVADGAEKHGIKGSPRYDDSSSSGPYALEFGSLGHDQGVVIPNVNDDYKGAAPDIGAQERGAPPLRFGVAP